MRKHTLDFAPDEPLPSVLTPSGCLYNEAVFSRDLSYFVLECKGPGVPRVLLYKTETTERLRDVLDDNGELRARAANMTLPKMRTFQVPTSSGFEATVKVFLPPEITVHTFASYPFIVQV